MDPIECSGGPGDDVLVLGYSPDDVTGRDVGLGGSGDDLILGSGDRDRLVGGLGDDTLNGADGADMIAAGARKRKVVPFEEDTGTVLENGHDLVLGGRGNDR